MAKYRRMNESEDPAFSYEIDSNAYSVGTMKLLLFFIKVKYYKFVLEYQVLCRHFFYYIHSVSSLFDIKSIQ